MNIINELKKLVDSMCNAFDTMGPQLNLPSDIGERARMDVVFFMMYLSASDGTIQWDEAKMISDISNVSLSPSEINEFIRKSNIYSTEFENRVPETFQIMVAADLTMKERGVNTSGSNGLLSVYKLIGESFVKSDGKVDDNELRDYNIYINMLTRYLDINLNGNNGVSAPRKR